MIKRLLVLLFVTLSAGSILSAPPEHASPQKDGRDRDTVPNLARCEFLKRRPDASFLKEKWHLDALGGDLFQSHPAVVAATAYEKGRLAIVDTGLRVAGNPAAGAPTSPLVAESPEREYDLHGTHVAGLGASPEFGVNPRVRIKAFPVPYRQPARGFGGMQFGTPNGFNDEVAAGFNHAELLAAVKRAANDPTVAVINLSLHAGREPAMREALSDAVKKGKWVVFAGGNESGMNTAQGATVTQFLKKPEVFSVGALSYFATPATFSNFGPEVNLYAPGSEVESLNADFNANLAEPRSGVSFSGTSMAAPLVAGILTTLRAMSPSLDAADAKSLLERTAIVRGEKPRIRIINPLHAAEILSRATKLLASGKCDKLAGCFDAAEKAIVDERPIRLAALRRPKDDAGCDAWKRYYDGLRTEFFLSDGKRFGDRIAALLRPAGGTGWAEAAYFAPTDESAGAVSALRLPADANQRQAKELAHGNKFHAGELLPVTADPKMEEILAEQPKRFLERLPGIPENVGLFLRACPTYFSQARDRNGCAEYLSNSPKAFLVALGNKLLEDDQVFATADLTVMLQAVSNDAGDLALAKRLLEQTVKGWKNGANVDELEAIYAGLMDQLTPAQRTQLLTDFQWAKSRNLVESADGDITTTLSRESLERLYYRLLSWGTDAERKGHDEKIDWAMAPAVNLGTKKLRAHSAVGNFLAKLRRLETGAKNGAQVAEAFADVIKAAKESDASGDDNNFVNELAPANPFHTKALTRALDDPEAAREFAKLFSRAPALKALGSLSAYSHSVLAKLIAKVDAREGAPLVRAIVENWNESTNWGHGRANKSAYEFLLAHRTLPYIDEMLKKAEAGPQTDAALKALRLAYLAKRAKEATSLTPEVTAFLAETPGGREANLTRLSARTIANAPELHGALVRQLDDAAKGKSADAANHLLLFAEADPETFRALSGDFTKRFGALWRASPRLHAAQVDKLVTALVKNQGADESAMRDVAGAMRDLLADRDYLKGEERDALISRFVHALDSAKAGRRVLAADKALTRLLADRIAGRYDNSLLYDRAPQGLVAEMRTRLPSVEILNEKKEGKNWVTQLLQQDPESIERGLAYLDSPKLTNDSAKFFIRNALASLVKEQPALAPRLLEKAGDETLKEMVRKGHTFEWQLRQPSR